MIDGYGSGPPFVWRANDARNTDRQKNIRFSATGYAIATKNIPAADLSSTTLAKIAPSELLVRYDASGGYWRLQKDLGTKKNPIVFSRGARPLLALRM